MPENYVLLERTELNADATSVTFSNIPQTGYTDLKIVVSARTNNANNTVYLVTEFNGVSSGYTTRDLYGTGSAAASRSLVNTNSPVIPGSTSTANVFSNMEIYIPNYASNTNKSYSADSVTENNGTTAFQAMSAILWSNTAAITSIKLTPELGSLIAGSTFSLYGIAALGTTPAIAPKASGGNRIDNDGTYWYHTFTSSGSFVPQTGLTADVLVVAGGGGGGGYFGGGGGAGGYRTFTSQSLVANSYNVTVGAGGAGNIGPSPHTNAVQGGSSQFGSLTVSTGGGGGSEGGGQGNYGGGFAGGSGGGGGSSTGNSAGGAATPSGQGNAGGTSPAPGGNFVSAGGGGAGAAGGSPASNTSPAGAGGVGLSTAISGGATTGAGQNVSGTYFFAGGGGGGGGTAAAGGNGGGGAGGTASTSTGVAITSPTNGTSNTGGGGGGGNPAGTFQGTGASGGSGIVIIRYPIAS
jgi:hypothetical protein